MAIASDSRQVEPLEPLLPLDDAAVALAAAEELFADLLALLLDVADAESVAAAAELVEDAAAEELEELCVLPLLLLPPLLFPFPLPRKLPLPFLLLAATEDGMLGASDAAVNEEVNDAAVDDEVNVVRVDDEASGTAVNEETSDATMDEEAVAGVQATFEAVLCLLLTLLLPLPPFLFWRAASVFALLASRRL